MPELVTPAVPLPIRPCAADRGGHGLNTTGHDGDTRRTVRSGNRRVPPFNQQCASGHFGIRHDSSIAASAGASERRCAATIGRTPWDEQDHAPTAVAVAAGAPPSVGSGAALGASSARLRSAIDMGGMQRPRDQPIGGCGAMSSGITHEDRSKSMNSSAFSCGDNMPDAQPVGTTCCPPRPPPP